MTARCFRTSSFRRLLHAGLVCALLLTAGCGSGAGTGEPAGELVLLSHYRFGRISPVAKAIAKVEHRDAVTDADGATRVTVDVGRRALTVVNYATHDQVVRRLQDTARPPVAAVLVVVSPDGLWTNEHGEQLRLAQEAGVPVVATLMSQVHLVDDEELLDLMEQYEIKETLEQAGFVGVPTIRGSAVRALEDDPEGMAAMQALLSTVRERVSPLLAAR